MSAEVGVSKTPLIAVVDYGIGNLRSAQKSLQRAGADARLTDDAGLIADADGVVLPGVGHFGTCMTRLRAAGLEEPVLGAAASQQPFIGICVGMAMLFETSQEAPGIAGLGVLPGAMELLSDELPRPQMQWNRLCFAEGGGVGSGGVAEGGVVAENACPLLTGLDDGVWMYFVHSYAAVTDAELVMATCDYPAPVTALVQSGQLWATQFHPEKSGPAGGKLIANFVAQAAVADGRFVDTCDGSVDTCDGSER